jgi:predicted phage gp36 major capsid-like protein
MKDLIELALKSGVKRYVTGDRAYWGCADDLIAFALAARADQAQRIAELEADNAHYLKVIEDRSREAHQWWSALQESEKKLAASAQDSEAASMLGALVDVWYDMIENPPTSRCYVQGAWAETMNEARTLVKRIDAAIKEPKP